MTFSNTQDLIHAVSNSPETIEFKDVIALVDSAFTFTSTAFTNGDVSNEANQNNGSCKLLALGQHLKLNHAQTLALFGRFYREDVLNNPNGDDHANIRNFMKTGHEGVVFDTFPLVKTDVSHC
ncbi:HopJ type III effector protein [Alteromonas sp. KUL106]|uniref:HopJ type III effector protein n=1 Tax=Alteromonas sp. KUL106 TaxID=2480799 RepID=UPI0012E49E7F|nr:HopJ type III effector protein [Alteromonas sp. KUL106]GFD67701.1 type III effector [Alteromonas sp. KUL106]